MKLLFSTGIYFACLTQIAATCVFSQALSVEELELGALLKWSTQSESENNAFFIEKSLDGGNTFFVLGSLEGKMRSNSETSYSFLDISLGEDNIHYRLKQMDLDGTITMHEAVVLNRRIGNSIMVSEITSTEIDEFFEFILKSTNSGILNYNITNVRQEIMKHGELALDEYYNFYSLYLGDLVSGTYHINLRYQDELETVSIYKKEKESEIIRAGID